MATAMSISGVTEGPSNWVFQLVVLARIGGGVTSQFLFNSTPRSVLAVATIRIRPAPATGQQGKQHGGKRRQEEEEEDEEEGIMPAAERVKSCAGRTVCSHGGCRLPF